MEFPSFELDLRAIFHMPRAGLGRADAISLAASLRRSFKGAGREFVVERI